jgi:hypothetical protein
MQDKSFEDARREAAARITQDLQEQVKQQFVRMRTERRTIEDSVQDIADAPTRDAVRMGITVAAFLSLLDMAQEAQDLTEAQYEELHQAVFDFADTGLAAWRTQHAQPKEE